MDQLFSSTRTDMESCNDILSISLDDAISLCKRGDLESARDRVIVISGLFDRLAKRISHVNQAIRQHASHFGIVPNVKPLYPSNFRGASAQKVAMMDNVLAKVLFRERTRFFHKLDSLGEIIGSVQIEARVTLAEISVGLSPLANRAWDLLEVLGYDLNTCMGETTILLKSFFCALPADEVDAFREKLDYPMPSPVNLYPGPTKSLDSE
jgi:hypothetical protein